MKVPTKQNAIKPVYRIVIYILLIPILMQTLSGDSRWAEGWMFMVWYTLLSFRTMVYLHRNNPQLLAELPKNRMKAEQNRWNNYIEYELIIGFVLWLIVMPLDAKRFEWSSLPYWVKTVGAVGLCYSYYFIFFSYKDNLFLSPQKRLQQKQKQQSLQTGVYSMVRHPMYLGIILLFICAPMLMGSVVGLMIGVMLSALMIRRIVVEENLLNKELDGYIAYTQTIKFRLIPFVW